MGNTSHLVLSLLTATLLAGAASAQNMVLGGSVLGGSIGSASGVGDVNGDGRDDYLEFTYSPGPTYSWQIHDGVSGVVIPYLTRTSANGNDSYRGVGDVDGDANDDLVYYMWQAGTSTVVSGADGSTISSSTDRVLGGCDLDGDGLSDLLLNSTGATGIRTWIRSSRTGLALYSRIEPNGSSYVYSLRAMGDENGDGYADALLVAANWSTGAESPVGLVRGPTGTQAPSGGGSTPLFACGDVDGDGADDLLALPAPYSGVAPIVLRGGAHTVLWTLPIDAYVAPLGDVDGDGFADVATLGPLTNAAWSGATQTQLAGVAPTFTPRPLGDIDGDGRVECAMSGAGQERYEWHDPALPISSRMLRRGVPGTTSSGRKPVIVTRGHCGLGHTAWFDIRGCEPNSIVAFAIGGAANVDLAPLGAPGNRSYTTMLGLSALLADGNGLAKLQVTMPTSPALLGATASVQAAVFDPAANALGLVTSTAVDVETRN